MRQRLTSVTKKVLPKEAIDAYRRRRALRRYLRSLSYELYDRNVRMRIEELEGTLLARRPDITERLMKDVLDRSDLVLQELHRQIEAVRARHGTELRELRDQIEQLRSALEDLHGRLTIAHPAGD